MHRCALPVDLFAQVRIEATDAVGAEVTNLRVGVVATGDKSAGSIRAYVYALIEELGFSDKSGVRDRWRGPDLFGSLWCGEARSVEVLSAGLIDRILGVPLHGSLLSTELRSTSGARLSRPKRLSGQLVDNQLLHSDHLR